MVKQTSKKTNVDFDFFTQFHDFYRANKGRIRNSYRNITKRFLDHNNPDRNPKAFLRQPQFEALEIYVFLKEYLDNAPVHEVFDEWADSTGKFQGSTYAERSGQTQIQLDVFKEAFKDDYESVFKRMKANARDYSNYIFALTMGTGKTILMATCIFYEFILANKFPKDKRYCHNALVFAPDKTVLQSLREIQTFDMTKVVPAEYVNFLNSNIKFYFLDEAGVTLNTMDHSRFNVIISNTQKIILKKNTKEKSALDKLLESGKPDYKPNSVYDQNAELWGFDEPDDEVSLSTNQRFEKLRRIEQLGIYIDEAHHIFGTKLANTIGIKTTKTSLRLTVDELANSLRKAGTQVVACYNYTGTPYVGKEVLPEVVYAYGLRQAIDNKYLKKVRINGYSNTRTNEFVEIAISDFLKHNSNQRYEGMLPKMAFFAANIDELQKELRPAVEKALEKHGIPSSSILVNVGDTKLTTNDDIREFNRLDTPESEKQFILLVNKGREGWNCRSLFSVALFRKPKSKIFVLQATMRCLRAIGTAQPTGHVYLSEDNKSILEKELDQNFRISISDLEKIGKEKEVIEINPVPPPVTITLKRVRKKYDLVEKKKIAIGINLELDKVETDKYRIIHTEQEGLTEKDAGRHRVKQEDLTDLREKREFSEITLVAEISRYLNKSCLFIENILATTQEGTDEILDKVNEFNEVLYDWVIPRLFKEFYDIDEQEDAIDEYPVQLVKLSKEGFRFSASEDMIARRQEAGELVTKSFHLDTYCFDSKSEKTLFWDLLKEGKIKKIYFTGMLTHGQSDFYIQYIDPDSHTVRSYYPDFLFQRDDDSYVIVEVKADGLIDEPVVQAKKQYAEQWAGQNEMTYKIIASSDAEKGNYASLL